MLNNSENIYNITNEYSSTAGTMQFAQNEGGGGTFKLGGIVGKNSSQALEIVAHEVFHGLQHELGQGGASIKNEVEAYSFGFIIQRNWMHAPDSDYLGGPVSIASMG